jgi:hypothetical protein
MNALLNFLRSHGTKVLGFAQVTLGVLSTVDGIFSPREVKLLLIAGGLATAWRGYFNSQQNQPSAP